MANIDELLEKNKGRIDKMSNRKKMVRSGPARPWQENLANREFEKKPTNNQSSSGEETSVESVCAPLGPSGIENEIEINLETKVKSSKSGIPIINDVIDSDGPARLIGSADMLNSCRLIVDELSATDQNRTEGKSELGFGTELKSKKDIGTIADQIIESEGFTQTIEAANAQFSSRPIVDELSTIDKQCSTNDALLGTTVINDDIQLSTSSRLSFEYQKQESHINSRQLVDKLSAIGKNKPSSVATQLSTSSQSQADQLPTASHSVATPIVDQLSPGFTNESSFNTPIWTRLGPAQAAALIAIYQHCEIPSFRTTLMTKSYFITSCNISDKSVGSTIQKLVARGFISRLEGKGGIGGFMHFQIDPEIFHKLKKDGADSILPSIVNQLPNQLPAPSSKLVSKNINLLTTSNTEPNQQIHSESSFDAYEINIEQLTKFNITRKQIQDIKNQKLNFTTSTLQDFVDRFVIYASDPKNVKNVLSLSGIFVKMAQLASKGEDPLVEVETDSDRLIREHLERAKTKREERSRQLTELVELEFENWLEEIKMEGRDKFAPPSQMMKSGSIAQKMTLKQYFTETIWPEKARQFGITSSMEVNT